jgi:hypothetical protein
MSFLCPKPRTSFVLMSSHLCRTSLLQLLLLSSETSTSLTLQNHDPEHRNSPWWLPFSPDFHWHLYSPLASTHLYS